MSSPPNEPFQISHRLRSFSMWFTLLLVIVGIVYCVRSCTNAQTSRKAIYTIGRGSSWYPIQLYGRERKLVAFTNDLLSSIGTEYHLRFEWIEANSQSLAEGLDDENYDFIITDKRPNIVNEDKYNFSEIIFELGPVLIVRFDSPFTKLEDMNGRSVGITTGFSTAFNAIRTAGANTFDPLIVTYDTANRTLDALVADQIDGVLMPAMEAYSSTQGLYSGKLKVVTPPLNDEGLRIVALASSKLDQIISDIDMGVNKMRADGSYSALTSKWELIDPETAYWKPPKEE